MISVKYKDQEIVHKRSKVNDEFLKRSQNIKSGTIESISPEDIGILFELYDRIFLNQSLTEGFLGSFTFSLSKRMTKSAGLTLCPRNIAQLDPRDVTIEIRIGVNFFFQYDHLGRAKTVSGIPTKNALEALQLVVEHEICHALEFIHFHRSSCKGDRFKNLAKNLFGHTSSYHQLPTNRESVGEGLDIHIGDEISFIYRGKAIRGFVQAIHKRATVMVRDKKGNYRDHEGNRYVKYYVPISQLQKIQE